MRQVSRILLLAISCLAVSGFAQENKPFLDPDAERQALRVVDAWLEASRELDRIPAMSVGVVRGDKLVWTKGYGTVDKRGTVPADAKTLYSVCSITKLFTSIAVMRLYDQQKVRLDDDLARLLPEHRVGPPDSDAAPITVRGLLSHSSGLPREAAFAYWSAPDFTFPTTKQVREKLSSQSMLYQPAQRYQYSNLGILLVGEVIANVTGQSYESYVTANVLDPLGMKQTRFGLPMDLYEKQLAVGYGALKRDGTRDVVNPFRVEGMAAAAGLTSNVEDLARFISWNFHLLRSGGTDIVRASTLRDMQRVHWTDMDGKTTWGLGFAVRYEGGKNIVSHAGWCPGYRTGIRMQPDEDLGIIVLTNVPNNLAKYTNGIAKILAKAKKIETTKAGEAVTIFEEYAGRYNSQPWSTELVVLPWGTHLAAFTIPIDDFDAEMGILKPTGKDTFRRVNDDNTLGAETRFERGANGRVTRIVTNSQFSERLD